MNWSASFAFVKWRMIKNGFSRGKRRSALELAFVLAFFLTVSIGGFLLFYKGLGFLKSFPVAGPILLERLLYLFLMALFLMLFLSNAIVCFVTLFRAEEVGFLFSCPLSCLSVFILRFIESSILSSWAPLLLGIPFILAYGSIMNAGLNFYLMVILLLVPFLIVAACLGTMFTLSLMKFFAKGRMRLLVGLLCLVGVVALLFPWKTVAIDKAFFSKGTWTFLVDQVLPPLKRSQFPLWPHFWVASSLLGSLKGKLGQSWFYFFVLLSNSFFALQIALTLANRIYYPSWATYQAGSSTRKVAGFAFRRALRGAERILNALPPSMRALIIKDVKVFFRDPSQWSQFAVYCGLLVVYIANIRHIPYRLEIPFWRNLVSFLNLGATSLTLGALSIRFIFPQVSIEGRRVWLLASAPIHFKGLIMEKFWLSLICSLILTEGLIILSNTMLRLSGLPFFLSCWTVFLLCFGLTGLCLGMGAIYPNFKEDNPAKIVSGFGATLTFILAIFYVGAVIAIQSLAASLYMVKSAVGFWTFKTMTFFSSLIVFALTVFVCIFPLRLGISRLNKMEF